MFQSTSTPFFSIVTACKNGHALFQETIPTIINQTFKDWEWVIVDDGSNEPLDEVIRYFSDPRIRVFRNHQSVGQTACLNKGIRKSNSNWIVRMDGDDLAHPKRLEETYQTIRNSRFTPIIFSDYDVLLEDGRYLTTVEFQSPLQSSFYKYFVKRNNLLCHPSVTFFKYSPNKDPYFYDENLRNAQDYALWRKIIEDYEAPLQHIPHPLVRYRLVKNSLSGARIPEQFKELRSIRSNPKAHYEKLGSKTRVLSPRAQKGMYAFRVLYYRFIGKHVSESNRPKDEDSVILSVLRAGVYPKIFFKALFFALCWPIRMKMKNVFFKNIYR